MFIRIMALDTHNLNVFIKVLIKKGGLKGIK